MALEKLVNLQGKLAETYPQLDPNTIQHASEIMNDRREDKKLRNMWFLTADSALYTVEDDQPIFYFGDRDNNLIFRNLEEATKQLIKTGNYKPSKEDAHSVIDSVGSGKVLRVKLSDLAEGKYNSEFNRFEINTSDYGSLNKAQREFTERVYGQREYFSKNMEMLNKERNMGTISIYVLDPDDVKKNAGSSPIVRACWLGSFNGSSSFGAGSWDVDDDYYRLRGVRKVAEGDSAQKSVTLQEDKMHKLL